nr:unnamed protein product [Callosobruchus chinensis]
MAHLDLNSRPPIHNDKCEHDTARLNRPRFSYKAYSAHCHPAYYEGRRKGGWSTIFHERQPGVAASRPLRGEVYPSPTFYSKSVKESGSISATVYVEDIGSTLKDSTRLHLNIFPIAAKDCSKMVEDICFWADAKYQIEEDVLRDMVLGSLSSPYLMELCSSFKMAYTIADDNFYLIPQHQKKKPGRWV